MTLFILACALLLALALGLLARPLLQFPEVGTRRWPVFIGTAAAVVLLSASLYPLTSNWSWSNYLAAQDKAATQQSALAALQRRTQNSPSDVDAWLSLAQAEVTAGNLAAASAAYDRAYELTQGRNIDAITGLAETLVLADTSTFNPRVAALINQALQLQPTHPKALWYGGMVALQTQDLSLARERFSALLALNPPPQVRSLLQRQVQDLDEQLQGAGAAAASATVSSKRQVEVKVTLAATIRQQLKQPMTLFVLARHPAQPGPPLAVQRHSSSELPLQVALSGADAMLPNRTLADAQEVEIVARLSISGAPTEQSGDYVGRATYSFKQGEHGSVAIEINQRVP